MMRTSVAELKARLGHFLRMVGQGETIEVQSHHHPVARIVPMDTASATLVIPPELPMAELRRLDGVSIPAKVDVVGALRRDRSRR